MKCALIGGAGFIGLHLAEHLLAAGHAVRVFDLRDGETPRHRDIEWMRGNFLDAGAVRGALTGCDAVYHLAWTSLPKSSNENPAADVETNVLGTLRLLEAWRGHRGRFVFVSSGGTVYGVPRSMPITEDHPTQPISSYGITKLAVEKYLELYRVLHGLDYHVLRLSNPFGERQRVETGQGAVTAFLYHAFRGEPVEIWGDGRVVRDYIYIGDIADALVRMLDYRGSRRVLNIGSGIGRDLNQIAAAIEAVTGRKLERRYLPGRGFDVPANVLDVSLARAELGWRPATSFEEGLARTLASLAAT